MRDSTSLLTNLRSRYNPDNDLLVEGRMYTELSGVEKTTAKYIKAAMSEVDHIKSLIRQKVLCKQSGRAEQTSPMDVELNLYGGANKQH